MTILEFSLELWQTITPLNLILIIIIGTLILDKLERRRDRETVYRVSQTHITYKTPKHYKV